MTEASQRARSQLARLRLDRDRVQKRLEEIPGEKSRWEERARREASKDEARALECVRRAQQLDADEKRLRQTLERLARACDQLGSEIGRIDSKIQELKCRKSELAVRDSQLSALRSGEVEGAEDIEEVFDRWEARLAGMESPVIVSGDPLEAEFEKRETDEALRAKLGELLKK
jgi:phage shock protein A